MPKGRYSRKYRKFNRLRKSKKIKVETNAQLTKDIKKIKRTLKIRRPELKHYDNSIGGGSFKFAEWSSATNDTALAAYTMFYPKQGTGVDNRVGDRINIKGLDFRFTLNTSYITQDIDYTIYLLRWNEYTSSAIVTTANILTFLDQDIVSPASGVGLSTRSFRNIEKSKDWTVLKKVKGTMKQMSAMNVPNQYYQNVSKTMRITYNKPHFLEFIKNGAGDATQVAVGAHVLLFVAGNASDVNVAGQLINVDEFQYRLTYTDT